MRNVIYRIGNDCIYLERFKEKQMIIIILIGIVTILEAIQFYKQTK